MDTLERLGRLALELQRGAREQPLESFLDWALGELNRHLPFDAGVWGSGHWNAQEVRIHSVYQHHLPAQFIADYAQVQSADELKLQSVQRPGVTIPAVADRAPAAMRPFLARYGLEHALSTVDGDRLTSLLNCIAIYRRDRARPFDDTERSFMQAAYPLLIEACTQNRLTHLVNSSGPRLAGPWRPAAADRTGLLHYADKAFSAMLLLEWPGWTGPYLPLPLQSALASGHVHRYAGQRLVCKISPMADLSLVQVREGALADQLTPRERQVAAYSAQGYSHKEIARLLELAPATVRNHLATACRRVQVKNKAQMAALIQSLE